MCHSCVSRNPGLFSRKREFKQYGNSPPFWIPACAGMTPSLGLAVRLAGLSRPGRGELVYSACYGFSSLCRKEVVQ